MEQLSSVTSGGHHWHHLYHLAHRGDDQVLQEAGLCLHPGQREAAGPDHQGPPHLENSDMPLNDIAI